MSSLSHVYTGEFGNCTLFLSPVFYGRHFTAWTASPSKVSKLFFQGLPWITNDIRDLLLESEYQGLLCILNDVTFRNCVPFRIYLWYWSVHLFINVAKCITVYNFWYPVNIVITTQYVRFSCKASTLGLLAPDYDVGLHLLQYRQSHFRHVQSPVWKTEVQQSWKSLRGSLPLSICFQYFILGQQAWFQVNMTPWIFE